MDTEKELNYRLYVQKESAFRRTDIKSEFEKYSDIKYGDVEKVKENIAEIRKDYYKGKGKLSDNPLRNTIYHFVVAAGIIARVCIDGGMPHDESYTLSDIYIRKADSCTDPQQVIELLFNMQLDYATRMKNLRTERTYSLHIRNAIDYIHDHLHEQLTMEDLAEREQLNPNYFSKLFVKETGCTAKAYILNAKLNTARNMLLYSDYSLTDIALALGFSSQSAFTAAFKKHMGATPGDFRKTESFKDLL